MVFKISMPQYTRLSREFGVKGQSSRDFNTPLHKACMVVRGQGSKYSRFQSPDTQGFHGSFVYRLVYL